MDSNRIETEVMDKKEYDELTKTINYHMDRYYNQDEPEISDYDYDQLMLKLKAAEARGRC